MSQIKLYKSKSGTILLTDKWGPHDGVCLDIIEGERSSANSKIGLGYKKKWNPTPFLLYKGSHTIKIDNYNYIFDADTLSLFVRNKDYDRQELKENSYVCVELNSGGFIMGEKEVLFEDLVHLINTKSIKGMTLIFRNSEKTMKKNTKKRRYTFFNYNNYNDYDYDRPLSF
jgi:hypothetical protein